MTPRRLGVLARHLPDESATSRACGGYRPGQWHNVDELLAQLLEMTFEGQRLFYKAHAKKGSNPPPSLKVPRPESVTRQTRGPKRQASASELAHFLGGRRVVVNYTPKGEG